MAGIHQTLREARSLYAEAIKLQEAVLASHQELKDCVAQIETWQKAVESLMSRVESLRWGLKNLTVAGLAALFMLCIIAGLVGGALALLLFRLAVGVD